MIFLTAPTTEQILPCVATIGFFDGVHQGHRFLIDQVKKEAQANGLASMLITFPVHPRKAMQTNYQPKLLSSFDEKCRLLSTTGADYCAVLPFTAELASFPAYRFMEEVLYKQFNVRALVIGHDHRFGHNRSEGFEEYVRYGNKLGIRVVQARAYEMGEVKVSSSVCRLLLQEGEVGMAARCLGYRYTLAGEVVGGHQVGRTLGYPTANLHVDDPDKLIPADGVYAVRVEVDGASYTGMLNIGCRPTIDNGTERTIEVHLLHFQGDLYTHSMCVEFIERIRSERKFDSREELVSQLASDARKAEQLYRLT